MVQGHHRGRQMTMGKHDAIVCWRMYNICSLGLGMSAICQELILLSDFVLALGM